MAAAFDAKTDGGGFGSVSSKSWTHTSVGTTNLGAYVSVGFAVLTVNLSNPTCTYGGAAMTSVISKDNASFGFSCTGQTRVFRKENPATGAQTAALTWASGANLGDAGSLTATGVNQSNSAGNTNSATGNGSNNASPTVTSSAGNLVLDGFVVDFTASSVVGTQTSVYGGGSGGYTGAGQYATATTPTMGWSWSTVSQWSWCGMEIVAAATATTKQLAALGAG